MDIRIHCLQLFKFLYHYWYFAWIFTIQNSFIQFGSAHFLLNILIWENVSPIFFASWPNEFSADVKELNLKILKEESLKHWKHRKSAKYREMYWPKFTLHFNLMVIFFTLWLFQVSVRLWGRFLPPTLGDKSRVANI